MLAAEKGRLNVVNELLKHLKIDINAKNTYNDTALMLAAKNNNVEVVKKLLKCPDIDLHIKEVDNSVLEYATEPVMLELLKDSRIQAKVKDKDGDIALILAASKGYLEVVKKLLTYPNIDINAKNKKGDTALICAAIRGRLDVVKELLTYPNIDINAKDKDNDTALMCAAYGVSVRNGVSEKQTLFLFATHPRIRNKDIEASVKALKKDDE
jgi:ankyrin repeat protein